MTKPPEVSAALSAWEPDNPMPVRTDGEDVDAYLTRLGDWSLARNSVARAAMPEEPVANMMPVMVQAGIEQVKFIVWKCPQCKWALRSADQELIAVLINKQTPVVQCVRCRLRYRIARPLVEGARLNPNLSLKANRILGNLRGAR